MSLDTFFGAKPPIPQERCSDPDCRKPLGKTQFKLTVKGQEKKYCRECYKKRLPKKTAAEETENE
jgi:hypothetical protein